MQNPTWMFNYKKKTKNTKTINSIKFISKFKIPNKIQMAPPQKRSLKFRKKKNQNGVHSRFFLCPVIWFKEINFELNMTHKNNFPIYKW